MAHPGTLPAINKTAVAHVLRVGKAVGGTLANYTEFDRKNYFYPDLPKGYQLSQYAHPLVSGGTLFDVGITRIHLEEDTARSAHDPSSGVTRIDYNRAGVPLMELVTEPEIHTAKDAVNFAKELQILLRTLGASDANMERGEMRIEANVSLGVRGTLGTKVEIKNLNSFRSVERAIEHELKRQKHSIEKGLKVEQQTLGWDEHKQSTFPQRTKEGSADYRYFPDPDLPKLVISEVTDFDNGKLQADTPELPWEKRARLEKMGLNSEDASMYVADERLGSFFDSVALNLKGATPALAANYISTDVVKLIRDIEARDSLLLKKIPIAAHSFAQVIDMVQNAELSSRGAKTLIADLCVSDFDPKAKAVESGLLQQSEDIALIPLVKEIINAHPGVASEFVAGKESALQFLVGQAMKKTRGSANPQKVHALLKEQLSNPHIGT